MTAPGSTPPRPVPGRPGQPGHPPTEESLALGSRINQALDLTGVSQRQLAVMLGSDQAEVSRWVRGVRMPSEWRLKALAEAIGYDYDTLRGDADLIPGRPPQAGADDEGLF